MTWDKLLPMLWEGTVETLYMTLWSSAIAYLIGLPLGVLLVVTRRGGIMPSPTFNAILGVAINFLRSIPFIIMLAVLVVLGGGIMREPYILGQLERMAAPMVKPSFRGCRVVPAALGNNAGLMGAGYLAANIGSGWHPPRSGRTV